ncbi:hypothetical protein ACFSBZ_04495 [Amnibacterium flavum]|nr:hypothetical protein [Amnibacterium flavum]
MESVCGYRVLRDLGGGRRSEVMLARDADDRVVVLRLFGTDVAEGALMSQIGAARAVDCDHLLPLVDVATTAEGRVLLVTPWLAGGSLGELLATRGALSVAEAVGVLVAVLRAVEALHDAGWSHGRVHPSSVLLASDGTPVLAGLGDAAPLDEPTRVDDREGLAELATRILPDAEVRGIPRLLRERALREAELAVLASADPRPVSMTARSATPPDIRSLVAADSGTVETVSQRPSRLDPVLGWLGDSPVAASISDAWGRMRTTVGSVRRGVWLVAALSVSALIAAAVLIPQTGRPAEALSTDPSPRASIAAPEPAEGTRDATDRAAEPTAPSSPSSSAEPSESAIDGDDPLSALVALLDLRERCYDAGSVECLDGVDQAGSAAYDADASLVGRLESGAVRPPRLTTGHAPFVQRTGDSALVATTSVSVLLIRTEEGWRIRDTFDAPPDP